MSAVQTGSFPGANIARSDTSKNTVCWEDEAHLTCSRTLQLLPGANLRLLIGRFGLFKNCDLMPRASQLQGYGDTEDAGAHVTHTYASSLFDHFESRFFLDQTLCPKSIVTLTCTRLPSVVKGCTSI